MDNPTLKVKDLTAHNLAVIHTNRLFSGLRRITSSGLYLPEIDGLRFIAILSVVLFHIALQTGIGSNASDRSVFMLAVSNGYRGVPLFFAISGFILGLPFANQYLRSNSPVRLKSYFLRRVTRLEPPYMLVMILRAALLVFVMHKPLRLKFPAVTASLCYVHNLVFGMSSIINPPAWSLEIEIQFYCLAPLLGRLFFRNGSALVRRGSIERPCMDKNWPSRLARFLKSKVDRTRSPLPTI